MLISQELNNSSPYDFTVIGAGLAGLAIAEKLHKKGASVLIIEKDEIASGASGTPLGLVNPATGRFGTKSWKAENCYHHILSDLEEVQSNTNDQFYKSSGILRPAIDEKIASKMQENLQNTHWPEKWCSWVDSQEINEMNPDLECVSGGLWIPIGLTVNIPLFLISKAEQLRDKGVRIITGVKFNTYNGASRFVIKTDTGEKVTTKSIIWTAGIKSTRSPYWKSLPLIPVKGQVAILSKPSKAKFNISLSALGYMGSISSDTFVIGSTYEHKFEHVGPDDEGFQYMKSRLERVYPTIFSGAELISQWAGVRASTPNRMPILGKHPEVENLYIFAGLGSKGLLYSVWLAEQFSNFIFDGSELPKEVSLGRFKNRDS